MLVMDMSLDRPLGADHPCRGCKVRTLAMCRVLDCDTLAAFRNLGTNVRLRDGQTLFHEGDPATRVFTLTSGAIKLYKLLPDGRRQVTGFLFAGDFLGLSLDDEHAFTAEALGESELCCFSRGRFDRFVAEHPSMERALFRLATNELASAQRQMVLLGRKTAEERLASFFMELSERRSGDDHVDLVMSRADIGDYLGLTKETVSRVLAIFKAQRIIRLERLDRIHILDLHRLADIADALTDA